MATLQTIRNRAGILVAIVIGFALFAFILGDLERIGQNLFNRNRMEIGEINGKSVQYPDYQKQVDQLTEIYKMNTGNSQMDENTMLQVRDQVWQNTIRENVMGKIYDDLGLTVSSEELFDMLQGANIHPTIQQIFQNPNTGQVDRSSIIRFLKNLQTGVPKEQRDYWYYLEQQIQEERIQGKYSNLLAKGLYVTNEEVQSTIALGSKQVNFDYVALLFSDVPDSTVSVSEKEIKDYYNEHISDFKQEKTRKIEYIAFRVTPSTQDFNDASKWIEDLKPDYEKAEDNVQFVNTNSDESFIDTWYKKETLPENIGSWIFDQNSEVNAILGPYFENNAYKIARVHKIEMMPDSVQARHILLKVNSQEEAAKVKGVADSLKALIEKGTDFATLARLYSTDTGSAQKGGDLGWFRRGSMVKPFEDAAFNNKEGETSVAASQFGIHIIQTTKHGQLTKQVQVAYLIRNVVPSSKTYSATYGLASRFASENPTGSKFQAAVSKQNLEKKAATVLENDINIAGLTSARPLVRAAYDADKGDLLMTLQGSTIFELGDDFVIGMLVDAAEEGNSPLASVRARVELAVQKEKKKEVLLKKAKETMSGKSTLSEIASALNSEVNQVMNINFNSFTIPGVGLEPGLVGAVTSAEPLKILSPVAGNNGVFIAQVTSSNENPGQDISSEKTRLSQTLASRAFYQSFETQKKAVTVVDKRSKFY